MKLIISTICHGDIEKIGTISWDGEWVINPPDEVTLQRLLDRTSKQYPGYEPKDLMKVIEKDYRSPYYLAELIEDTVSESPLLRRKET